MDRLKEMLKTKLLECGWRDQLKEHCKGVSIGPRDIAA
jgi:enhancer of yellow 2 transcription factor